jgi:DNA-binding SARP family transcriptional activator/TolB-like protein
MKVELYLLGGVRLQVERGPTRGKAAQRRRLAIMAMLAAAPGRTATRDRVIAHLWPDGDAESARRLLSEALYVIRKEIDPEAIIATGDDLRLNEDVVRCDVVEFRDALSRGDRALAVAAYGGPFLDGWFVSGTPEFERWSERERARLSEEYARALEALAVEEQGRGNPRAAIPFWQKLQAADPYSSHAALQLGRALLATGERALALQALVTHERRMREELEVDVPAALRELMAELRGPLSPERALAEDVRVPTPEVIRSAAMPDESLATPALATPRRRLASRLRWALGAGLAAVTATIVWLATIVGEARDPTTAQPPRVAIFYFDDQSDAQQLRHIADGLTEELIHQLGGVNSFEVVSRTVMKQFRGRSVPFDTIVRKVKAETFVEGSVQLVGDSLRVVVQLIEAATGRAYATDVIQNEMPKLGGLEREIAQRVAERLRVRMGRRIRLREVEEGTKVLAARTLVLRAQREVDDALEMAKRRAESGVPSAIAALYRADSLYLAAERADPTWSRPLIGRGSVVMELVRLHSPDSRAALVERGLVIVNDVLQRDSGNAQAYELRGTLRMSTLLAVQRPHSERERLIDAERDLRRAVQLDSTLSSAWGTLSLALFVQGKIADARVASEAALRGDTYLTSAEDLHFNMFVVAHGSEDFAMSREWCRRGREAFSDRIEFVECELTILRDDESVPPDTAAAWRIVRQLDAMDPPANAAWNGEPFRPVYRRMVAAAVSARAGDGERAHLEMERARRAVAANEDMRRDLIYQEARVWCELGDHRRAIALVDEYAQARPVAVAILNRDPFVKRLRSLVERDSLRTND